MSDLNAYIRKHTERGECQCGKCVDKGPDREAPKHSVNVHFFWVSAKDDPKHDELLELIEKDLAPHLERLKGGPSYIELGGYLGSQELAIRLIGLGELVGLWDAVIPEKLGFTGQEADDLAGRGMVMISGLPL